MNSSILIDIYTILQYTTIMKKQFKVFYCETLSPEIKTVILTAQTLPSAINIFEQMYQEYIAVGGEEIIEDENGN